eukprot:TRINITY_DN7613_c0_g1_i1.p2 TRINITY_DN7613_c0_g1~~TRINITY_DN7613_c0_g1_i1.p2  ORF type:complete len:241 (-),score=42.63 TRINITY_DN7613_c0_g1_i1:298-1020(-)
MWTALGTFLLWFGWYGFNVGSLQRIDDVYGDLIARIAVNTSLAAAGGAVFPTVWTIARTRVWDINIMMNGILAGLVSITSGCLMVDAWAAYLIGFISGMIYIGLAKAMLMLKIDDPLEACGIHMGSGAWAMISVSFFARQDLVVIFYGASYREHYGVFMGGDGLLLGVNLLALVTVGLWTCFFALLYFGTASKLGVLRITKEEEKYGMDVINHMHMTHAQKTVMKSSSRRESSGITSDNT